MTNWLGWIARFITGPAPRGGYPAAFASLETVSDAGLATFDGVARGTFAWARVKRITAAMGRQHYDMTICLTIDLRGGKTIFLPENHPGYAGFLAMATRRLSAMKPPAEWTTRLGADPDAVMRVYPA